jgi:Putative beta-barrel porin-2, OmpL-like. bbp2
MSWKVCVALAAEALFATGAAADGLPAGTAEMPPAPSLSGYINGSFNHLSGEGRFTGGMPNRVFDTKSDGFALQQAGLNLVHQPTDGFGGVINLLAGEDADVIKAYGDPGGTAKADVPQAYVQWAAPSVTLMGGKFATLAGAEQIPAPLNGNFSRSILFGFAIPFTHTGLRSAIVAGSNTTLYVGVNNGWDDVRDAAGGRTVEFGALFTPAKAFSVTATGYFGPQRVEGSTSSGPEGQRSLVDIVMNWNVTADTCAILNIDAGRQSNVAIAGAAGAAHWSGIAGYLNHRFGGHWKASARVEYFTDPEGYRTGVSQVWREATSTVSYVIQPHWEFRGELREDRSDASSFLSTDGGHSSKSQNSVAAEMIFNF